MSPTFKLPRLYVIVDSSYFSTTQAVCEYAKELIAGGVSLLQYRNKTGNAREMLEQARRLKDVVAHRATLIMNDRADLALLAEYDGVHVGQDDLSPGSVRQLIGSDRLLGVSTHNSAQMAEAAQSSADYVAIGPVFATSSKVNPDPVIGLAGVREARSLTSKSLVAIGGITPLNCRDVIEVGADCVAVISALLSDPRESAGDFLRVLR